MSAERRASDDRHNDPNGGNITLNVMPVREELTSSGWYTILAQPPPANTLNCEISCDSLVVGGGWMGLHCARRLAELQPDASIVLTDAGRIGNNAAGRCAGFAIDLAHNARNKHFAENIKVNNEEYHINLEGIAYIRKAVDEHGVDCDWSPEGKYHGAATRHGIASLQKFAKALENIGQIYTWIDKEKIQRIAGSKHYIKALYAPGTVLLQPAKYMRNAMQVMPNNCVIYEETPVTGVIYQSAKSNSGPHICQTPQGVIRARKLFLCNAGYITQFGFFSGTAIPLYTFASMTRPLSDSESDGFDAGQTFGIIPANSFGTTVRRTSDNRLFLRNVYSYARDFKSTMRDLERAKAKHHLAFERRYPQLADIGFESSWGGMLTLSYNGGMIFGEIGHNVYATAFCNGTGVSRGAAFGKALAEYAVGCGSRSIDILLSRTKPSRGYPQLLTELGVRMTTTLRLYRAGREV